MDKCSEAASPSCRGRSKKPNLHSSKVQSPSPVRFSSQTPEKPPQRIRNRGVALSIADIRKAGKGLQEMNRRSETTSSQQSKSVRRQISLWPSSPSKSKITDDESSKLPEKYEILDQFFDRLDTLISMFRLKGKTPSFTEISSRIESLTDRRFTHGHLAQLKYILPEAIVLKKFLVHDERTCCMKPDIHISLNPEAVESDAKGHPQRRRVSLKKLFQSRVRDFLESHPEVDEIPEGTLPEPFNRPKKDNILDMLETRLPTKLSTCMRYNDIVNNTESGDIDEKLLVPIKTSVELPNEHLKAPSVIAPSFRARFSLKVKLNGADDVQQNSPSDSLQPSPFDLASEAASSLNCSTSCASLEPSSALPSSPSKSIEYTENKDGSLTSIGTVSTPTRKTFEYTENKDGSLTSIDAVSIPAREINECTVNKDGSLKSIDAMSTPAKLISTPIRLMSATPALCSPKRHYMSPDDQSTSSLNKLARRPPRSRSLKFDTPVKNKEAMNEDNTGALPIDDDVFDILPGKLIQSIREKERIAMEERDPAITQAKKRKKMIANLPKLFDMIRLLLRQRNCITKVELVSKIISSHSDIVDRSEVEEQLSLLQELAPEWISEKQVSSGDFLLFINKLLSPETIRASLEEAT
ncbi:CDT1-like protein a, chloroplastic [Vigna radiata var. radiata]|uniref:CDT1-like protein a, chloroplastic n=1 Tax=Vigna radiata var. radiata TaxID=3916 RepID=A0A1S3UYC0_VIGRR|nr:CDT1-like protein a, chloroplastic [Vigna radiata var. radiata]